MSVITTKAHSSSDAFAPRFWRAYVDTPCPAGEQMQRDIALAEAADLNLRLFTWQPCAISTGRSQSVPDWCKVPEWNKAGLEVVERPTGGGIAFHGSDLSWSFVIPRRLKIPLDQVMRAVCACAVRLCRTLGAPATSILDMERGQRVEFCLTQNSPYAIVVGDRKVAGYAIRRYPGSWLVQASMLVEPVKAELARALPAKIVDDLCAKAVALGEVSDRQVTPQSVAELAAHYWPQWWYETIGHDTCAQTHDD